MSKAKPASVPAQERRWNELVFVLPSRTLAAQMTPYGQALLDYHKTGLDSTFALQRDDGFMAKVSVASFFDDTNFSELEQRALDLCQGKLLDIGAGAGRHSLALQRRGLEVTAVDILPEAVFVMRERGVRKALPHDVMTIESRSFDTLLMLNNGIGMVGTPSELDRFLSHAGHIVNDGGSLLCDSIDVSKTSDPVHVRYRERNVRKKRYPGQQFYSASYGNETSALFPWLHLDFAALEVHARNHQWAAELVCSEENGHYLAKLTKS